MKAAKVIGVGMIAAMVITALTLPGRSQSEATVLRFLNSLASGSIRTVEGR